MLSSRLHRGQLRRLSAAAAQAPSPTPSSAALRAAQPAPELVQPAPTRSLHPSLRSKRRLAASPLLPPEAVAISPGTQSYIEKAVHVAKATPRTLRRASRVFERAERAGAPKTPRVPRALGLPKVPKVADYGEGIVGLAEIVTGASKSLAACTYVFAEVRRLRRKFRPRRILDFGAGGALAVSAVARVFREGRSGPGGSGGPGYGSVHGEVGAGVDADDIDGRGGQGADLETSADANNRAGESRGRSQVDWSADGAPIVREALLVDSSKEMQRLGVGMLRADEYFASVEPAVVKDLSSVPAGAVYDVVSASYSLSEIVRGTMSTGVGEAAEVSDKESEEDVRISRASREELAEKRLKKTVKNLWKRVAPGGVLVIVEHGTLAGFETMLFAREVVLGSHSELDGVGADLRDAKIAPDAARQPRVVAPCLHSGRCPLEGNATRARVCRFEQRFNRPLFLRNTKVSPKGFEDTRFTYIVIERPNVDSEEEADASEGYWGRLIRPPQRRGKHVLLDACTGDGQLERRVSSKKNAEPGMYHIARKVRWGDVWPLPAPMSKTQPVSF